MDQIRFDFLNTQPVTALNRSLPATTDKADAFSQILDQQLAKARNADAQQQSDAAARNTDDRQRPADIGHPSQRSKTGGRRRDDKTAEAAAAKPKTTQKAAASNPKPCADKTGDTANASDAAKAGKAKPDDDKQDPAVGQTTSDDAAAAKTPAESQSGADAESGQGQQGDGDDDGQAATPKQDADAASAEADADLAALMIPLPLQTIATAATAKSNAPAGGASTPALQAALLIAANLNAGALNLAGATGNSQAQAGAAGLKFGAILPNPAQSKGSADLAPAGTHDAHGSDPSAETPDPSDAISAFQAAPRPRTGTEASASAKSRSTATAASPVTAAYAGQSGATTAQTAADPRAVQPWAAAALPSGSGEEALPMPAVAGDSESSGWAQYLDAGTASSGISARTAAFLAQLKQNVQTPPAHEQVAIQIQKAMQNGSNRLTVNLDPAELGRVEVKLDVDKDKNVTASIVVDRPATLDLLQRDAKALERALQDAGLQTNDGSLSFSLRNNAGQGGGNGANGQTGAGIGGGKAGAPSSEAANQPARADVIATADGYVDLET
jgi:flagellar hook-length control protein FliK